MTSLHRAPALLLGLAALAACDRPAPMLPAGRLAGHLALDDHHAALVVADVRSDRAVLAIVDDRGAPRWTDSLPSTDFAGLLDDPDLTATDDLVLLSGSSIFAFDRASGARRWQLEHPEGAHAVRPYARDGRILLERGDHLDALDPATGATLWSVTRREHGFLVHLVDDLVARTTDLTRRVYDPDEIRPPASRKQLEVVRGPDGAVVWSVEVGGHCLVDDTVLALGVDGSVLALDLAATPPTPRTVAKPGTLIPQLDWRLDRCARDGDTWWFQHAGSLPATVVQGVDRRTGARVPGRGFCPTGTLGASLGRGLVVLHSDDDPRVLQAYDLERRGLVAVQDRALHAPNYVTAVDHGELVFLIADDERIQHVLAVDATTGDIAGAVAIRGARKFWPAAGAHWLLQDGSNTRGNAPLVTLGHRDLRPLSTPPVGLDVVDTTAEARAAWRPPVPGSAASTGFDPAGLPDPESPCDAIRSRPYGPR